MKRTGMKKGKTRLPTWSGLWLILLLTAVASGVAEWDIPATTAMEPSDSSTLTTRDRSIEETSRATVAGNTAPLNLIRFSAGNAPEYAVVVEKETQQLILYEYNGTLQEVERMRCSTGKAFGPKVKSGDQKTPEGIYFFTKNVPGKFLSARYGSRALPIDYPNVLDRLNERTGHSIWLHGIDKSLKARNSNGCVVLENDDIDRLAGYISLGHTPLVIVETITYGGAAEREAAAGLALDFLGRWKQAMETDSIMAVSGLHRENGSPLLEWWPEWEKARQQVLATGKRLSLDFKRLAILKHQNMYVIRMELRVNAGTRQWIVGSSRMYVQSVAGILEIIGQTFSHQSSDRLGNVWHHPLAAVSREMLQSF